MAVSPIEVQREIRARELAPDHILVLRRRALDGLALLQERAVQAQSTELDSSLRRMTVAQKAAVNAAWAMRVIPVVSEILLKTGRRIEFTETFFTRSAINVEVVRRGGEEHVGLMFGSREITEGTELGIIEEAWQGNNPGGRRNIQGLAKPTPLEVIGEAYSAIYRIRV